MRGRQAHNLYMIRKPSLIITVILAFSLTGCSTLGIATSAVAVTGISAAQEGGISRAISDTKIKVLINEAWFQYDVEAFQKLSTTINQGRVLITGVVQNPEHRVEAVRLAWQAPGVTQVINEIRVTASEGITGFVKDAWITSRLRGALTLDRGVQSVNYSIDTVQGIVYLMGVAQNQAELNLVIEKSRTISGVKQVVSYVKLAGESLKEGEIVDEAQDQRHTIIRDNGSQSAPPQKIHSNTNTNTNFRTRTADELEESIEIDVPVRHVPEEAPSIEDQYYN